MHNSLKSGCNHLTYLSDGEERGTRGKGLGGGKGSQIVGLVSSINYLNIRLVARLMNIFVSFTSLLVLLSFQNGAVLYLVECHLEL